MVLQVFFDYFILLNAQPSGVARIFSMLKAVWFLFLGAVPNEKRPNDFGIRFS